MAILDQTPLAKIFISIFTVFLLYYYIGLFEYTRLTASITLFISLAFGYKLSKRPDEDLDVFGAFVLNGRGYFNPPGTNKPPSTVNTIVYLDGAPSWEEEIKPFLIEKLFNYRRFSSIGVLHPKGSQKCWNTQWVKCDMSDPSIRDAVLCHEKVSNSEEVRARLDDLCNVRLEPWLPRWRVHYIENANGASAWLWRVSHGLADGLRLVPFISEIFEDEQGQPVAIPSVGKAGSSRREPPIFELSRNYKFTGLNADELKIFYENGWSRKSVKREDGAGTKKKVKKARGARGGLAGVGAVLKALNPLKVLRDIKSVNDMLKGGFDTISPFKPDHTVHCPERQQIFRPRMRTSIDGVERDYLELEFVKKLKVYYKVSVNDVLTALFAGAVRRYILMREKDYFENQDMRTYRTNAMVAFGFPPSEPFARQYDWLGNGFTFVGWPIPVEIESFEDRLRTCYKNGKKKKQSLEAPIAMFLSDFGARLGLDPVLEDGTTGAFQRHSCVFSNVPGPPSAMYFKGARVTRIEGCYWNVVPQVICLSCDGKIFITLVADKERLPGIEMLCDAMVEECEQEYAKIKG